MTTAPAFSLDNELSQTRQWDSDEWDEATTGYADSDSSGDTSYGGEVPEESTGEQGLAERHALRRVAGLPTELEDITEVEYRQLRLERVVLAAVWTDGTAEDADNSMRELA